MKTSRYLSALSVIVLWSAAGTSRAQTPNFTVDNFDTDTSAAWTRWWGSATQDYEFDPATDANGSSTSGSLKATIGYDITAYGGDNQFAVQNFFVGADGSKVTLDGTQYTNLVFDLKFDPSSPKRAGSGDFGYFEYGVIPSDFSQIWLGGVSATNGNWLRVVAPIDPTLPKLSAIQGVVLKMWAGDTSAGAAQNALTGTTIFWVDNVLLVGQTNAAPVAAPKMAIQSAVPGLNLIASQGGNSPYQRQNIRTLNNTGYSWVGSSSPVTYSLTIAQYPPPSNNGFQTHLFLVPGASIGASESSPDYNEPNLIFLDIQNQTDGSANAMFRYKTNEPNGNAMVYNANPTNGPVGTIAQISNPTPLGTWSLTFNNDTSISLTTPSGTSTNFAIPAEAAALFADPLYVYVGDQPNNTNAIGQASVLTSFRITSGPTNSPTVILSDNFAADTALDTTNTWQVAAADPPGVLLVPNTTRFLVSWTTPANGFNLQSSADLSTGSWKDAVSTFGLSTPVQIYKSFNALIPASIPATNHGFFRLSTNTPAGP